MKKIKILLLLVIILTACAPPPATPSPQDIQTAIAQTQQAVPSPTLVLALPTREPTLPPTEAPPTPTPIPSDPIAGRVNAAFLNLRKGPSTLHEVSAAFEAGQGFLATGRVPGNDWVRVEIGDEDNLQIGWMVTVFLELEGSVETLPEVEFPSILKLRGTVEITTGGPVSETGIAAIYRDGVNEFRTDTTSNQNGEWVIYLPDSLLGVLDVQIVSSGCGSQIMTGNCVRGNYFELVGRVFVTVPQNEPIVFQYEPGSIQITGTVTNKAGSPVSGVLVVGVRDDLAESVATSGIDGFFSLPAAEGIWDVYTITFDPRIEGDPVSVTVTDIAPEEISLKIN